jgi:hypothetical protein
VFLVEDGILPADERGREITGAFTATLADGTHVPVGRTYRDGVRALMKRG